MHRIRTALWVSVAAWSAVVLVCAGLEKTALAQQRARVRVLIGFASLPGPAEEAIVRAAGGRIRYTYHLVPAIAASVPRTALGGLLQNPRVTVIETDGVVYATDTELDNTWGVKRIGAGLVHDSGNRGEGVRVAIVDTGIDYTHPELSSNYVGGYDFVNADTDPMDDHNHGTHVAGTVAAKDNGTGVVGVAPNAMLYGLKVLSASGSGRWSDIIAAIQWATDNGVQVTNNSYGGSGYPGSTVQAAFDNSYAAGVLHVASAGNSGSCTPSGDTVGYPAKFGSVMAVAATSSSNVRACFSSTGPAVEISAPGVSINSTRRGGGYVLMSGTSMASPHVAGVAALLMAGPLTNVEARQQLLDTADDLGAAGWDELYGFGLVDADEAAGSGPINNAPQVTISAPNNGDTFDPGVAVVFQGSANDLEDGDVTPSLSWTSNLDGPLGVGRTCTRALSEGNHTITASATDSGGRGGSETISVTIAPLPGTATVTSIAYQSRAMKRRKDLLIAAWLADEGGKAVSGATVTLLVTPTTGGNPKTLSGTTDSTGRTSMTWKNVPSGCYESVVTSVSVSGFTWDGGTPPNSFCQ